jgi:hypothetical protein
MLLTFMEIAAATVFVLFSATQVVLPFFRGTPPFPIFRREAKLQETLEAVKQRAVEKGLEKEIKSLKRKEGV